ncbi:MAG: rhodanese-like domain-containing protein [Gammaproteobacteria bacterium]|nr:rhodanese-like domain-containing protein [Gammaproteobacteria bacterium]
MVKALQGRVPEVFPWELADELASGDATLLLDIRCPHEFAQAHIAGSLNVPRGILEIAVDYGYDETEPRLVEARDTRVVVLCRSGNRSLLAAHTLGLMGFSNPVSLRTGLRGWNDDEYPLVDGGGRWIDPDRAERLLASSLTPAQRGPQEVAANPARPSA